MAACMRNLSLLNTLCLAFAAQMTHRDRLRHSDTSSMGTTDRGKGDLFDRIDTSSASGQLDLFDPRKRKAAAMSSSDRNYDRHERGPAPSKKVHFSPANSDLSVLLRGENISRGAFTRIQSMLMRQEKQIRELGNMLKECEEEIDHRAAERRFVAKRVESLEMENDRNKSLAAGKDNTLKEIREKEDLQKQLKEKDAFLAMATVAVKEKTESAKQVELENARLRKTVTERDTMISKMNEQIWRITSTPEEDSRAHYMLQAQASNTLGMVNGLKADVQCRDERIKDLEMQVGKMTATVKAGNQAKADLQRDVDNVKRELKKQVDIAEKATTRATEATQVAEQQEGLIKKILEENKRLGMDDKV